MKAAQARALATSVASKEAAEKSAALKKRRAQLKVSVPRLRAERIKKIEKEFRDSIKYAVETGAKETTICLSSDHHDVLRGQYKYLPTKVTGYDTSYYQRREIRTWYHAWGAGYLKYAPWGKYVKIVLAKLRRDGFKCEVTDRNTHHDDSAAYLNSGGECGSETPYTTRDTILTIKW
jgi:hypothetical protein